MVMSPLRVDTYVAVTSSEQPSMSCVSQQPSISAQRLLSYRFWSWGRLCNASTSATERDRSVAAERAKSRPLFPPMVPILANSSSTKLTGTGQRPPGELSAKRVSRMNRNEKNSEDRKFMVLFWSSSITK